MFTVIEQRVIMKKVSIWFIVFLFFFLFNGRYTHSLSENSTSISITLNSDTFNKEMNLNYEPQQEIDIRSDSALASIAVFGDGSPEDPYVLEGWEIDAPATKGIYITQTTMCFVIRNCLIYSYDDIAIHIENVGDSTVNITNNVCINSIYGIWVENSNNIIISGNNCSSNWYGMYLSYTGETIVQNNTCNFNSQFGMVIDNSDTAYIQNNTCNYNADGNGITAYDIFENSFVTENICVGNNEDGIELSFTRIGTNISYNFCKDNLIAGISLETASDCLITWNNLTKNTDYGIKAWGSSEDNKIHHNYFYENKLGGLSQAYDDSVGNVWYDVISSEGNYWKWWYNGSYPIDGTAGKFDLYPIDLDPPVIDTVPDFEYISGSTGNQLQWNVTDLNPSLYFVYEDFEEIESGTWTRDVPIVVDIDGLDIGTHVYQLFVLDGLGRSTLDTVIVTVIPVIKEFEREIIFASLMFFIIIYVRFYKKKIKK
jgi:parallel beta-helix repeat protein